MKSVLNREKLQSSRWCDFKDHSIMIVKEFLEVIENSSYWSTNPNGWFIHMLRNDRDPPAYKKRNPRRRFSGDKDKVMIVEEQIGQTPISGQLDNENIK